LGQVERGRRAVSSDFLVSVAHELDVPVERLFSELKIADAR